MNRVCQGRGRVRAAQASWASWIGGCVAAALLLGWAGGARAEPTADDKALATVLFQEGRTLMAEGRVAEACTKLEESQRLDPGGGTLLNLALCHEQEGRLARAWAEFNDALVLARAAGRRDRESAAVEHIGALTPRTSKLTIVVPAAADVDGLRIERDGRELGRGAWATAMPVDGGEHVVRATAPGKQPFATTIVLAKESDAKTVEIPILGDAPVVAVAPAAVSSPSAGPGPVPAPAPVFAPDPRLRKRRILAYVIGGAGLAQLGLVGYFGLRAFDKIDERDNKCVDTECQVLREGEFNTAADLATVFTVTGIVSVATSVYLLVTSRGGSPTATESNLTLHISGRGLTVGGRF